MALPLFPPMPLLTVPLFPVIFEPPLDFVLILLFKSLPLVFIKSFGASPFDSSFVFASSFFSASFGGSSLITLLSSLAVSFDGSSLGAAFILVLLLDPLRRLPFPLVLLRPLPRFRVRVLRLFFTGGAGGGSSPIVVCLSIKLLESLPTNGL